MKTEELRVFHLVLGAYSITSCGLGLKLSWITILDCWDIITIISTGFFALLVCLFELGNYTVLFLRAFLPILAV